MLRAEINLENKVDWYVFISGQGPSKKAAKHQAAEAALNILYTDAGAG